MYISKLYVKDLKCFAGEQELSLERPDGGYAGWTVFAGRNGAGKSTLLKALALSTVGPLVGYALEGTFSRWVREGCIEGRVSTELEFDRDRDAFQRSGNTLRSAFWVGLQWTQGQRHDRMERWLGKATRKDPVDASRGPWADSPKGWFIAAYGPYRHLGPPTAETLKQSANPVNARLLNLFKEAATLSESVDWLQQVHLRALEDKAGARELRDDVLALLNDGLLPDGSVAERVDSDGLWVRRDGATLPLEHVSDGYRTMTALVLDIVRRLHDTYGELSLTRNERGHLESALPGVVLIDEVDAHLHVAWQQAIGFWLSSRFPQIQFLVTTHSPFICQAASPRGIIRLPAPGEQGRMIEHIDERLFQAITTGGADDAVMSELFGLEHPHSERSEDLRTHLAELEVLMLAGTANAAQQEAYRELKARLPDTLANSADVRFRAWLEEVADR